MRVTVAGPIDLQVLQPLLDSEVTRPGYSFPMTAHLVTALVGMEVDVTVVATDPAVTTAYRLRGSRLDVRVVPMRPRARHRAQDFFRAERRGISQAIQDLQPDVVHAHWTYEFALAAEKTHIPTLVTVHDWAPSILFHHRDAYRAARLAMQVRAITTARHLSAVSPEIQRQVEKIYRKRLALVPNGLSDEYFRGPSKPPTDGIRYGALVNGDDHRKNLRTLLRAFGLRDRAEDRRLVLAGGGCAPGDPLHTWAVEHGLDDEVVFRGPMRPEEVPAYLAGLDVFVHPALEESFGMVILEAMAGGVPVIGGQESGAVPWLLDDGRAGMLSDVRSPEGLARSMVAMAGSDTRSRFAERGRERAESFRMARVAAQYVELYQRLLR